MDLSVDGCLEAGLLIRTFIMKPMLLEGNVNTETLACLIMALLRTVMKTL